MRKREDGEMTDGVALLPAKAGGGEMIGAWGVNSVNCVDALALLKGLPDGSVDMVLTDPPYAVHEAEWDKPIDPDVLMPELMRVVSERGAAVITCVIRLAWQLIAVNPDWFKYDMVGIKSGATDIFNAKNKPMRGHENILVFSHGTTANRSGRRMNYYPQMNFGQPYRKVDLAGSRTQNVFGGIGREFDKNRVERVKGYERFPTTVLIQQTMNHEGNLHPNQKDLNLFDYLVRSYTRDGDIVLDPYCGSGTTGVAARNLNRRYILGDLSPDYCDVARKRLALPYTVNMFEKPEDAA